jgi:3-methylcrotonyl-CoA carboxylase beta subunit
MELLMEQLESHLDTASDDSRPTLRTTAPRGRAAHPARGDPERWRRELVKRHTSRGKLSRARARRGCSTPGTAFLELSPLAAYGLYDGDASRAPGLVTGIGVVHGRHVMVVANDATVKGGTYYPMTVKKHVRHRRALENRLPCVYLVDSGGARSCRSRPRCSPIAITSGGSSTTRRACPRWGSRRSRS